jgi:nitrate/nitrite transporter NarK
VKPRSLRSLLEEPHSRKLSATRFCAIALCLTTCGCAAFAVRFAFRHHDKPASITALIGVVSALGAASGYFIRRRTTAGDDSLTPH